MTAKPNLALLCILLLATGFLLTFFGGCYLTALITTNPSTNESLQTSGGGFAFGVTAPLIQSQTDFNLQLNNLDADKGSVNAAVRINFECAEWSKDDVHFNGDTMYFLLQVPSQIDNATLDVDYIQAYKNPRLFNETFYYQNGFGTDKISLIIVEIPVENFSYNTLNYLTFHFRMLNPFVEVNPYTYLLAVPFRLGVGSYFESSSNDGGVQAVTAISVRDSLSFNYASDASLSVEIPEIRYNLNQIMPASEGVRYFAGNAYYSWNVKALSLEYGSDVILTIEDGNAKNKGNTLETSGWFLLGLGIPVIFTSILEVIREGRKMTNHPILKRSNFKNWLILVLIAVMSLLVIALSWLYFFL